MKIIDAINKINKNEKFKFRVICDGDVYKYIGGSLYNETVGERAEWIIDNLWLNEEIEIIEEDKKIEKLEHWVDVKSWVKGNDLEKGLEEQSEFNKNIYYKINEIIDILKKGNKNE